MKLKKYKRPSLKERKTVAERVTDKILGFIETFINGINRCGQLTRFYGVANLASVATNSIEGHAKNRRVEIVEE